MLLPCKYRGDTPKRANVLTISNCEYADFFQIQEPASLLFIMVSRQQMLRVSEEDSKFSYNLLADAANHKNRAKRWSNLVLPDLELEVSKRNDSRNHAWEKGSTFGRSPLVEAPAWSPSWTGGPCVFASLVRIVLLLQLHANIMRLAYNFNHHQQHFLDPPLFVEFGLEPVHLESKWDEDLFVLALFNSS